MFITALVFIYNIRRLRFPSKLYEGNKVMATLTAFAFSKCRVYCSNEYQLININESLSVKSNIQ